MITSLANVSLLVKEYDEAIQWYTEKLGLELRMDGSMDGDFRFVTVGVRGQNDVSIVLFKTYGNYEEARSSIHGLLFHSDDCRKEVDDLKAKGVKITSEPEEQPWGIQAVLEDLYGNTHVLLEPSPMALGQG